LGTRVVGTVPCLYTVQSLLSLFSLKVSFINHKVVLRINCCLGWRSKFKPDFLIKRKCHNTGYRPASCTWPWYFSYW